MSTNINDITLQSTDGTLKAKNYEGNMIWPEWFLDRQPTQEDLDMLDAQGIDAALIYVDGDEVNTPKGITVEPQYIQLHEGNKYKQFVFIAGDAHWTITNITPNVVIASSTGQMEGIGNARLEVTTPLSANPNANFGTHTGSFVITAVDANGVSATIPVTILISKPIIVGGKGNGETVTITLNEGNNYTAYLSVNRDRAWGVVEEANCHRIIVDPLFGLTDATLTITKSDSPDLMNTSTTSDLTRTAQFRVETEVFGTDGETEWVRVLVTIIIPKVPIIPDPNPVFYFIDPPGIGQGVPANQTDTYIYA